MAEHTKEPWEAELYKTIHPNTKMYWINKNTSIGTENSADARRIVACVNACAGISTELLKRTKSYVLSAVEMDGEIIKDRNWKLLRTERDELLASLNTYQTIIEEYANAPDLAARLQAAMPAACSAIQKSE